MPLSARQIGERIKASQRELRVKQPHVVELKDSYDEKTALHENLWVYSGGIGRSPKA